MNDDYAFIDGCGNRRWTTLMGKSARLVWKSPSTANKSFCAVLCFVLLLSLSGCLVNRTRSTIDDHKTAYAMTREQARDIVKSSIAAFISPDYVNQTATDSLTASGYIRAGIDTQTINVTAIPATGRDAASRTKSGYGFLLNDRGTIGYDPTPDEIWKYVLKRANQVGTPFRVTIAE